MHDTKPFPSGKSAYRFIVERQKALQSPLAAKITQSDGEFSLWNGRDRFVGICKHIKSGLRLNVDGCGFTRRTIMTSSTLSAYTLILSRSRLPIRAMHLEASKIKWRITKLIC